MIEIKNTEVWGFEGAMRGMRNPKNSWSRNDTHGTTMGENDRKLSDVLAASGSEHRKYARMIHVQVDVKAPLYWWKEADTYKVATVANSCSTMHKVAAKKFELKDFSYGHLTDCGLKSLERTIEDLNEARDKYLGFKEKKYWWDMIQLLPTSYNQLRTWDLNYETLLNVFHQRKHHKLDEWHVLCDWILTLPNMFYFLEATGDLEDYQPYEKETEER